METTSIKIFVPFHKKFPFILSNETFVPINVGRAVKSAQTKDGELKTADREWLRKTMIGDDTGENISKLNRQFCELTAVYWAWKHEKELNFPDYIGFQQYRRYFIFNNEVFESAENDQEKSAYKVIHVKASDKDIVEKFGLKKDKILEELRGIDGIVPIAGDLSNVSVSSLWADYVDRIPGVHIDDLMVLCEFLKKTCPEFYEYFDKYMGGAEKMMYQSFVLKRELFDKYCDFLFNILFSVSEKLDISKYTENGKRTLGYMGELIFGAYFSKLQETNNLKKLGMIYIEG